MENFNHEARGGQALGLDEDHGIYLHWAQGQ